MSLKHSYNRARNVIDGLPPEGRDRIIVICREIRQVQNELLRSAADLLTRCTERCQGLCCRNIQEESLITFWDLVFILVTEPGLQDKIALHLEKEDPLFPSDCLFLENGVGPCIFPSDVRPERCLTAFCFDADPARKEIGRVRFAFHRLAWTTQSIRIRSFFRSVASRLNPRS
jgi:hypothetical protein